MTVAHSLERDSWRYEREGIDLAAMATGLLGPAAKRSGGRLWWRCPLHSDGQERTPSFCVDTKPGGEWRCFGCNERGDAAALVMKIKGMSFPEARAYLTGCAAPAPGPSKRSTSTPRRAIGSASRTSKPRPKPGPPEPSGLPYEAAVALVEESTARLWETQGAAALAALRDRGISDDVIRAARLGYCPGVWIPKHDGEGFYHASGIVIPWRGPSGLMLVKIRQPEGAKPKYAEAFRDPATLAPAGGLYTATAIAPGRAVVITEGELDALCLASILGDAAAVATLGSAALKPEPATLAALLGAPRWYTAMDADQAGDKAAAVWPARARRIRPPEKANDWCDAYRAHPLALLGLWSETLGRPELLSDANRLRVLWLGMLADPYTALERDAITHENN